MVRLTGGPGNQLFQLVAALDAVDGEWGRIRVAASRQKDFRLIEGLLGTTFRRVSRAWMFLGGYFPQHRLRRLRKLAKVFRKRIRTAPFRQRRTSRGQAPPARTLNPTQGSIRRIGPWAFASGYFQDAGWAPAHAQTLADRIMERGHDRIRTYGTELPAVNVRGGDYERNGWVLRDAFYEGVIRSGFLDGYDAVSIVGVAPSDVERVARIFEASGFRVERPTEIPDPLEAALRDFFVMVSAPRIVMSNSTFCWWATRTSPAGRRVAYPSGWIDHDPETPLSRALSMPSWESYTS